VSEAAVAGWYDDGQHPGQERYWDGAIWTEQYRPIAPIAPAPYVPAVPAKRRVSIWAWLAPLIVVVLAGIGVGVWLIVSALVGVVAGPTITVAEFNKAWNANDCNGVLATVTQAYDDNNSGDTCDIVASEHADGIVYTSVAQSTDITNGSATVVTREQWTQADGTKFDELVEYQLVLQNGTWLIDSSSIQDGEATPVG
jgi:hypothetical protein